MNKLYQQYIKMDMLPNLFCPGCGNGIAQSAFIRAVDAMQIRHDVACVSGIGCSSWIPCYLQMDVLHTIHGRAMAFAEGLKMSRPDKKIVVFTGDGDCLAIGGNHFLHAAKRNIDITVIMVNNFIYGMTGGQKSPSTPEGASTKTSPFGAIDTPIDGCALAASLGASYVARWTTAHPNQLEKAIRMGMEHKGFSFIEVLSQCPEQGGKYIFGDRDPGAILKFFKEGTYIYKEGDEEQPGKFKLGLLKYEPEAPEYIAKVQKSLEELRQKGAEA